jgi:hypothetical protein
MTPASTRSRVDLPLPFGPTTPIRAPGGTLSESRSSTGVAPNSLLTFSAASVPRMRTTS